MNSGDFEAEAAAFDSSSDSVLPTDIMQTSFNDYESRVGINSVYRIRALNALNFAGPWSLQVTGSVPTPGVTGGCSDSTGALIFTSNADQTGAASAADARRYAKMLPIRSGRETIRLDVLQEADPAVTLVVVDDPRSAL